MWPIDLPAIFRLLSAEQRRWYQSGEIAERRTLEDGSEVTITLPPKVPHPRSHPRRPRYAQASMFDFMGHGVV